MKLSDYIANFLAKQGVKHVFAITGGASAHFIDSIARTSGIKYICPQHEQAGAMAADAYARVTRNIGVAISTSGPGATNMLTGVSCSFYDSIPALYITGQISTSRSKSDKGIKQLGFQEMDIVAIFKPVTKYAVKIVDPKMIRYELEKAIFIARSGRPGPVLLDIPDNLQRIDVDPDQLEPFKVNKCKNDVPGLDAKIDRCIELICRAKRPMVILGWGIYLSGAEKDALRFVERSKIPVVLTWAMRYLLPDSHPQFVGSFGTHGTRYGNFAVQNSDFVLCIGNCLNVHHTGSAPSAFAREAKKVVVDLDTYELKKFKRLAMNIDLKINSDAKVFFQRLNEKIVGVKLPDLSAWHRKINLWKEKHPVCPKRYFKEKGVNPYVFIKTLSEQLYPGDVVIADTGCSLAWLLQAFSFKKGQKLFSAFNNTPMGYALPASIGASFALNKKPVICITGDGGLQMNIQELATAARHDLPLKIFLFNNHGYSMIRQTQDQWFHSRYEASTVESGLAFPDFIKLAKVYGFKTVNISKAENVRKGIQLAVSINGPVLCNIEINPKHRVIPQVKYGRALEDAEPLLDRKEFLDCMIVKPLKSSLE